MNQFSSDLLHFCQGISGVDVVEANSDGSLDFIAFGRSADKIESADDYPGPMGRYEFIASKVDALTRQLGLRAGNVSQNARKSCDVNCGNCRDDNSEQRNQSIPERRIARNFSDLSEKDQIYVLRGGIIVCVTIGGLLACLIAYRKAV
jgi:hypothetical protein